MKTKKETVDQKTQK